MHRHSFVILCLLTACGSNVGTQLPATPEDAGAEIPDTGPITRDAGPPPQDAGPVDVGSAPDVGPVDTGVVDAGPAEEPLPFPPPEEGPPPEAPRQVACGGCEVGAERCLSARSREVCADDGQGCVQWRAAPGCAADQWCSRGACSDANPCRRPVLEACFEDVQRTCVDVDGELTPTEARHCDAANPPPQCDVRAEMGVISFSKLGVGSCVQVNNVFGTVIDGELIGQGPNTACGPCSWHQCVLDPDTGTARLVCRSQFMNAPIDWTAIDRASSPPIEAFGYTCSDTEGLPVQGNSKIKRGGSHPWMVASHYQGTGCPVRRDWN